MEGTNDNFGMSIAIDISGNVYTTGSFVGTVDFDPGVGVSNLTPTGFEDFFISKLDSRGNFVWAKTIEGTGTSYGFSIAIDLLGNVYTAGFFQGTIDFDPGAGTYNLTGNGSAFISKLDSSGNFVWAKAMNGTGFSYCYSIALDSLGNVCTTGDFSGTTDFNPNPTAYFNLISSGANDIFISELDSSGNFKWAKAIGGIGDDVGMSIILDPAGSGDVYTTGYFTGTVDFDPGAGTFNLNSGAGHNVFISKLNNAGDFVWAKTMSGLLSSGQGNSIVIDPAGSGTVYTTGYFNGTVDFDPGAGVFNLTSTGSKDIFISKLNSSGNFVWAKTVGGLNDDVGFSIFPDASGNLFLAGNFYSPSISFGTIVLTNVNNIGTTSDIFIAKLDTLTTGIESVESNNVISVYPNPVNELLVIRYSLLGNKKVTISITDITGKIIYSIASAESQKLEVNTTNFSEGIYLVQIKSEDFIETKKIIVVK